MAQNVTVIINVNGTYSVNGRTITAAKAAELQNGGASFVQAQSSAQTEGKRSDPDSNTGTGQPSQGI